MIQRVRRHRIRLKAPVGAALGLALSFLAAFSPRFSYALPEMNGATQKIKSSAVNNGGDQSSSANHIMIFSAGEDASESATSSNFVFRKGFWNLANYPGTITTLVATSSNVTTAVNLTWIAPGSNGMIGNAGTYVVRYSSAGAIETETHFSTNTAFGNTWDPRPPYASEAQSVTGLSSDTTYYFSVKAATASGVQGFVSTFSALVYLQLRSPGVVSFATYVSSIGVTLASNGNEMERTSLTISSGDFEVATSSTGAIGGTNTTLFLSNLIPNTTFAILTRSLGANNGLSTATVVAPSTATLAAVPGASAFAAVNISSIVISWSSNGNPLNPPTSYQMQVSASSDFTNFSSSLTVLTQGATEALSVNTSYYFRVAALNRDGRQTDYNAMVATTTLAASPLSAISTFTSVGISSITAQWNSNGNPNGTIYIAEISTWSGFLGTVTSSTTFVASVTTAGLAPGATLYFRVKARNGNNLDTLFTNLGSTQTADPYLSISIDVTEYDFGNFTAVQSTIAANSIVVINSGNIAQDYLLKASTGTTDTPWSFGTARGNDIIVLNSLFNSSRPADEDFHAVASTLTFSNAAAGNSGGNFAGNQAGTSVPAGVNRNLWFRLGMPLSTSVTTQQLIQVTITAQSAP